MSDASGDSIGGGTKRKLIRRKGCDKACLHFKLLTSKNYWIFRRNIKLTMVQIIAPIMFCLLILFFQWTSSKWLNFEITRPAQEGLHMVPHCSGDPACTTIGYSIIVSYINSNLIYSRVKKEMTLNTFMKL